MPWSPEAYNRLAKQEESKSKKNTNDDWWERHKSYIEHRKEFPYYPEKNKLKKGLYKFGWFYG